MDILATVLFLAVLAAVLAVWSPLPFVAWMRREIQLMRAETFQGDYIVNPALGTRADPVVARMDMKRKRLGKRMKKQRRSLLADKPYTPVLTKKADEPAPPRADKVVIPLRRSA